MRVHSWPHDDPPELHDLVYEEPMTLQRGFLVVGVEETRTPDAWRLVLERLDWSDFSARLLAEGRPRYWGFVRDRR